MGSGRRVGAGRARRDRLARRPRPCSRRVRRRRTPRAHKLPGRSGRSRRRSPGRRSRSRRSGPRARSPRRRHSARRPGCSARSARTPTEPRRTPPPCTTTTSRLHRRHSLSDTRTPLDISYFMNTNIHNNTIRVPLLVVSGSRDVIMYVTCTHLSSRRTPNSSVYSGWCHTA